MLGRPYLGKGSCKLKEVVKKSECSWRKSNILLLVAVYTTDMHKHTNAQNTHWQAHIARASLECWIPAWLYPLASEIDYRDRFQMELYLNGGQLISIYKYVTFIFGTAKENMWLLTSSVCTLFRAQHRDSTRQICKEILPAPGKNVTFLSFLDLYTGFNTLDHPVLKSHLQPLLVFLTMSSCVLSRILLGVAKWLFISVSGILSTLSSLQMWFPWLLSLVPFSLLSTCILFLHCQHLLSVSP